MLQQYLQQLGLSDKEQKITLVLAEVGIQPASVIARRSNLDRVTTYKHLKKMARQGFVKVYYKGSMQEFGIESPDVLSANIRRKAEHWNDMLDTLPTAMNILRSLHGGGDDVIPRLQMFEGEAGIQSLFRDMRHELKQEDLKQVRMLSSNTFEEWLGDEPLARTVREFFDDVRKEGIDVDVFEITGGLVPERLRHIDCNDLDVQHLPVARGTTNIFLVGHTVYLASYRGNQIGLKITQRDMSQVFHFLFDFLGAGESS